MKTRDTRPRSGPFEGYAFRTSLLQAGDVLLCTDPDSVVSALIKSCTNGSFSHAAICTYVPLFIEANDPGIAEISLDRMGLKSEENAGLLRLRSGVPSHAELAASAAREALRYATREYSTIAAIASVVPGWGHDPGARAFCSYLVAAAYESAGLNITGGVKTASKTTPADIEASPFFEDITQHLLVRAEFPPGSANHFLDSSNPISPAQEYSIALRKIAERVSALLKSKGQAAVRDYPEAQRAYLEHLEEPWFEELDALFSDSLDELGESSLERAEASTAEARAHDIGSLPARLAQCDRPSFFLSLERIVHRIDTTERLMADREKDLLVFGVGVANTNWKTPRVWLAHAQRMHAGLEANLHSLRYEWQRNVDYGVKQGWLHPDGSVRI